MNKNETELYEQFSTINDLYNKGDYSSALSKLLTLTHLNKHSNEVEALIATCYLQMGKVIDAQSYIDNVLSRNSLHPLGLLTAAYRDLLNIKSVTAIYIYTRVLNFKQYAPLSKSILKHIKKNSNINALLLDTPKSFFFPKKFKMSYWNLKKSNNIDWKIKLPKIKLSAIQLPKIKKPNLTPLLLLWNKISPSLKILRKYILITILGALPIILLIRYGYLTHIEQIQTLSKKTTEVFLKTKEKTMKFLYPNDTNMAREQEKQLPEWKKKVQSITLLIASDAQVESPEIYVGAFEHIKQFIITDDINNAIITYNSFLPRLTLSMRQQFEILMSYIPPITFENFIPTHNLEDAIKDNKYLETYIIIEGDLSIEDDRKVIMKNLKTEKSIKSLELIVDKEQIKTLKEVPHKALVRYDGFSPKTQEVMLIGVDFKDL